MTMLIIRYLLIIFGLSVISVLIVSIFFGDGVSSKRFAIYVISFTLGFTAFELWWRRGGSR